MERENDSNSTDEIEITPKMIAAGSDALRFCDMRTDSAEDIVSTVFEAMLSAAPCVLANKFASIPLTKASPHRAGV
jgi:hypothetical protein